jgi:hypothetical protein
MTISIFGPDGSVRDLSSAIDVAAIEALSDPQHAAMLTCVDACKARDAGSARVIAARLAVRAKEREYDAAVLAGSTVPRNSVSGVEDHSPRAGASNDPAVKTAERIAAMKAVSAAQRPGYVALKAAKENSKASAIDTAAAELAGARVEFGHALEDQKALEATAGVATDAFRLAINEFVFDKTLPEHLARSAARNALMKDHIARQNAERVARVARGEPAEASTPGPVATCEWEAARNVAKAKRAPRPLMR